MATLSSGTSVTFGVQGDQTITLDTSAGTEGTLTWNAPNGVQVVQIGPMPMVGKVVRMNGVSGAATLTSKNGAITYVLSASQLPAYALDASGNVAGLVGPNGPAVKMSFTTAQPYKAAYFGDSRSNGYNGTTVEAIGSGVNTIHYRSPPWTCAFLGDTDYARNYGVSGDTASNWAAAARTNGKTFADLNKSDVDVVFIQYGVNDAIAGTAASTIAGYLQQLIAEIFKSGKLVVFESIYPVASPASNYATAQPIVDATNALMQTWLAQFPTQAVYVDVSTTMKAGGQYASPTYIAAADGIHPTRFGAYTVGKLVAAAARALLPKRTAAFYGPASPANNLISQIGGYPLTSQFNTMNQGTATVVQASGQDSNGFYYEWTVTPLTFGTTYTETVMQIAVNFQTASPPYYALTGGEILQGGARLVVDDGAGGSPNVYSLNVRQRFFTGTIYNDWGTIGAPNALDVDYGEKLDVQILTPRMTNTTASSVASPAANAGYVIQVTTDSQVLSKTFRVRLYNPQLRRVGYSSTPVAVTPPASASAYTNNTNSPQQVFFAGGTVSAITVNGVATGLTSGVFILNPGDTLTPTYTVAPTTFTVQQLMTQPTMRGLM